MKFLQGLYYVVSLIPKASRFLIELLRLVKRKQLEEAIKDGDIKRVESLFNSNNKSDELPDGPDKS